MLPVGLVVACGAGGGGAAGAFWAGGVGGDSGRGPPLRRLTTTVRVTGTTTHDDGEDDPQGDHGGPSLLSARHVPAGQPAAASGSLATFWLTTCEEPPGAMVTP